MVRGGPAPNTYVLPTTIGARCHDPTKLRGPVFSIRSKHEQDKLGLGPGFYNLTQKTRYGPSRAPAFTVGAKLPDISRLYAPAPTQYRPEKYPHQKLNPPKFTIAKRTQPLNPGYVPAPNTYTLPFKIGRPVPSKHFNGAFTMGFKIKTPRGEGIPAPNRYGPVAPDSYKPSGAKYTMGKKRSVLVDKTQKPAPNTYFPKFRVKQNAPKFSFRQRDVDGRIIYFTIDDVKQH